MRKEEKMGIAEIKRGSSSSKKPKKYADGVYIGEITSITTAVYESEGDGGETVKGKKFVLTYAFAPDDPQQFLGDVPFDKPTVKFEILLPQDKEVFVTLFGKRAQNGLTGGYHKWSGDPSKIPSGQVELTITGIEGRKKNDGSGTYWNPTYKITDINPKGTHASSMTSAIDEVFGDDVADDTEDAGSVDAESVPVETEAATADPKPIVDLAKRLKKKS